jgi:hypothetical protein
MRKVFIIILLLMVWLTMEGQINKYGVPLIRNYSSKTTGGSEQYWCMTSDRFGNMYFGSQDRGVVKYDGTRWNSIKIKQNPRIYSLEADNNGIVYVGAAFEFGYIQPGKNGLPDYISLAERFQNISEIRFVYSIVVEGSKILFLSPKVLFTYDTENDQLTSHNLVEHDILDAFRLVKIGDKLILSDILKGLFEVRDSTITQLPGGNFFHNMSCTIMIPYSDSKILVGTFNDGLFLYDFKTGEVRSDFVSAAINEKFKKVFIYAGARSGEDLFAIGTTNQEGVLILNRKGELFQQINTENSDMEDNTAYAMYCDYKKNSELWISAYGLLSKVYVNIPLSLFSDKQGVESGVNEITKFNGDIYLSSDAGILKSYTDGHNNLKFSKVQGISTQAFPVRVISSDKGNFLLTGTLDGIFQISADGTVISVDKNCIGKPDLQPYNARKIIQSAADPSLVYFGLQAGGILLLKYDNGRWHYLNRLKNMPGLIYSMTEDKSGGLWFITDDPDGLYHLKFNGSDTTLLNYGNDKGMPASDLNTIGYVDGNIFVTSSEGIFKYIKETDSFVPDTLITKGLSSERISLNLYQDSDGDVWYSSFSDGNHEALIRKAQDEIYTGVLNVMPDVPLMDIMFSDGRTYYLKSKQVYVADKAALIKDNRILTPSFVNITIGTDSVVMSGTFFSESGNGKRVPVVKATSAQVPEFSYDLNEILFKWTTPDYTEELRTEYSYKLEGFEKNWSKWEGISFGFNMQAIYSEREYTNLPYGNYIFRVRTRSLTGMEGEELKYEFIILKPWYATIAAFFGFAVLAFFIVAAIIKAYTKKLKMENIRLEGIVAERTAVVVKQKEELESSIHYASRIQMALLPSEAILAENIPDYFILFRPRDIVSGDFYWMTKKHDRLYVVAADCTGHGVPGAFMSLLGMSFFDEILDRDPQMRADEVLSQMRLHVTDSLKQTGIENESKDGMDLGLLVFDFAEKHVEFSGAYNPCIRVRRLRQDEKESSSGDSEPAEGSMTDGTWLLETIRASKMPIGISSKMDQNYVYEEMPLEKDVSYYLFSDGYIDQFGGPDQRKFMKKGFKKLILDIQGNPMNVQKEILTARLEEWKGNGPQIDDILVVGLRID